MSDLIFHVDVTQKEPLPPTRNALANFITSTGGAALITVLLGGVAAQLISCDAQRRAQQREFNNTWLKSRGDQALLARKEFVDARRGTLDEILRSAGAVEAASKDLLDITRSSFATAGYNETNRQLLVTAQTNITTQFTNAELAWAPAESRFSFAVAYYGADKPDIIKRWRDVRASVNSLRKCAANIYEQWHMAGRGIGSYKYNPAYCHVQFEAVEARVEELGQAFRLNSDQPWAGWNNPDALKKQLHISE